MTEMEAEALAARLTRIWKEQLVSPVQRWTEDPETLMAEVQINNYWVCLCHVDDNQFIFAPTLMTGSSTT